jgi:small subunit ribosomal protein S3
MGQKVNPVGIRTGSFLPWRSRWFAVKDNYRKFLWEDFQLRKLLLAKLKLAGISEVEIERLPKNVVISVSVSRPGVVIGRGGSGIEEVKKLILEKLAQIRGASLTDLKVDFKVNEIKNPELSARLVAERIVLELERRMPHRRVVMRAMERVMAAGAGGVKVVLSGRIQGAEISRVEKFHLGSVPTQALREIIDYAQTPALLKRGYVGVKVWVYKKEE